MQIDQIPLDRLSVSKANMRSGKKPPDFADILPSIIKRGVVSPLFVRPNCQQGHFEIVAGNCCSVAHDRRCFALASASLSRRPPPSPDTMLRMASPPHSVSRTCLP